MMGILPIVDCEEAIASEVQAINRHGMSDLGLDVQQSDLVAPVRDDIV